MKCENSWIYSLMQRGKINPIKFHVKQDKFFIALYQSEKSPCLGSTLTHR